MRIFKELYGSKDLKAVVLFEDGTMDDWNRLRDRATIKAARYGKLQLPKIYPHNSFSFSVELLSGNKYLLRRTP